MFQATPARSDYQKQVAELRAEVDLHVAARMEMERTLSLVRESWTIDMDSVALSGILAE